MAKLWVILRREYRERVRTKWFIFATVFGPLFMVAMFVLPAWLSIRTVRASDVANMTVIDASGTELGQRFVDRISGGLMGDASRTRLIEVEPPELAAAESAATVDVRNRATQGYLVLGPSALTDTTVRYAGRNASTISDVGRIQENLRQSVIALRLEEQGLEASRVMGMLRVTTRVEGEQITERGRGGTGRVQFIFAAAVAFLFYMSILLYGQNVMRGVMEEKSSRVAEVVVSSARPETLLAGKVLGVGAVGLTQMGTWVLTGVLFARYREQLMGFFGLPQVAITLPTVSGTVLALLLLFFLLGFTFYASLYAAVGAMVNSEQEAQQAAQPMIFLVVATALLVQPVLMNPQSRLAEIVSVIPFSAPIIMPLRLALAPVSTGEIVLAIGGLVVACMAGIWLAARIYRVGLLMYGKRPTLRELGHWIMQAR
jgi:ABC-2 type transport system permease protein